MPTLVGPFNVGFPVNFTSGGDTTKDAFSKHIEEIKRIYGILNALDAGKVSASDVSSLTGTVGNLNTALTNHINSTNPHPNYQPSWSDLTNKPNLADLSGNLPMSRITGNLDASRITNLPTGGVDKGDGITDSSLSKSGYVKFNNGLIIQWGISKYTNTALANYHAFNTPFTEQCYAVTIQSVKTDWADLPNKKYIGPGSGVVNNNEVYIVLCDWDKSGFISTLCTKTSSGMTLLYADTIYMAIGK